MANSDKNIIISPNTGQSDLPSISLTGAGNSSISINPLDDSLATLSFRNVGNEQFFSLDTNLQGNSRNSSTIFKINDRNGQPLFSTSSNFNTTVDICPGDGQVKVHGHNYVVSACYTITSASASAINANNNGYMNFEIPNDNYFCTDPSVIEIVDSGNTGLRFWKDGIVHFSMSQDVISSGTGYTWVEFLISDQEGGSTDTRGRHLITGTEGQWDGFVVYQALRVRAGDILHLRWGGGDPTNIDTGSWSYYNILFYGTSME